MEALEFAIAICNEGLERALAEARYRGATAAGTSHAARVPGATPADLLFRLGYSGRADT